MSRCELTGKGPVVKNLVSHSNIKTKSTALPNIQKKKLLSQALDSQVTLNIAVSTLKSIEHTGGFDKFILSQNDEVLSKRALVIKNKIQKKLRAKKGN